MTEENIDYFSGKHIFKSTEKDDWDEALKERDEKIIESLIKARNLAEEINERLINEYISKVGCCDECFASIYCTVNGLRESRVPKDYCVKKYKRYFVDEANLLESEGQ